MVAHVCNLSTHNVKQESQEFKASINVGLSQTTNKTGVEGGVVTEEMAQWLRALWLLLPEDPSSVPSMESNSHLELQFRSSEAFFSPQHCLPGGTAAHTGEAPSMHREKQVAAK